MFTIEMMGLKTFGSFILIASLFISRVYIQPKYSLISDCDETFNYWEPLNLLVRGFGKQTWEYSPEYSIRSWAFLLPFYFVLYPFKYYGLLNSEQDYFYITRGFLGLVSFIFEIGLSKEIGSTLSENIGSIWLFLQLFNPGWFHASVELLPSSFAMILYLGSIKYALRYLSRDCTASFLASLTFNFVAGIMGWPFVLVLSVPLVIHYLFTHKIMWTLRTAFDSTVIITVIASIIFTIDSYFYGKFAPVSWNILSYNVINADQNSGPDIFGVEPWSYYVLNLILNFPLPVLIFSIMGIANWRIWPLTVSKLSWLGVFFLQPHKEERFLYPIYGLISLSAAIGFHQFSNIFFGKMKVFKSIVKVALLLIIALQSASRILALIFNYTAPITLYSELYTLGKDDKVLAQDSFTNVCTGREWYHFPNSFFLPENHRLRFIRSGFDGLLPGDFMEDVSIFDAVRTLPKGMNSKNIFDEGKLWPVTNCDYFVDISIPTDKSKDALNPSDMPRNWNKISCTEFINVDDSKILGRSFYIPSTIAKFVAKFSPKYWNKLYGVNYIDYCVYEKTEIVQDNTSI
ncbi:hypothetical protein Kpol_1014p43 [Vanderwaltozyma polyspora DSM 70294]|uniref:Mannosyltransferase n=1 Tax=Vanderwaltozyma polyspora (strain ATCC 22028 / DSM 70294 / BCRC 21397 / CBS 2163 / NBRC 10782 / NRRL Y-8283 / UCD 57-17) TaxID=436907 RepID=A7TNH0_VANPO|nr:uncharacterized protein Kpol_1014p43 [Vanderwaltozyma polyspora DSM 70294]EDO16223.1 hypothetical protein Kpol_1014p43 [Vanderwaltozyma polyspora DSM 70294]